LTVDSIGGEWREIGEKFPGQTDTSVNGGLQERLKARRAVRDLVLTLRRVAMAASADDFDSAARIYAEYKQQVGAASAQIKLAEAWSLFNPAVHEAHFAALRQLAKLAQ
jgi:hypothetical protein